MPEQTLEQQYADILRGGSDNSPLLTDGYKFSMAQAGFPLRHEYFYLHFRRGGAQRIPFDFKAVVEALRPRLPDSREQGFLLANGYGLTPAMEAALLGELTVMYQPKGTWANEHEPVLTVSGPSFLVSWLEPLLIAFNFPMQIATAMSEGVTEFECNCPDEAQIIGLVGQAMGIDGKARYNEVLFRQNINEQVANLRDVLGSGIDRAFEVGTRAMTCLAQHRIVLEELKAAGITRTANVLLAYELYMVPVGTTGHEHQERHGDDIDGFRAVRDLRPEPPSYLFDTYDPMKRGIPAAIEAMLENRVRYCSVRFDSGDQEAQLLAFARAQRKHGLNIFYLFMDGYDAERVSKMEQYADNLGIQMDDRHYGMGSYFVSKPALTPYTRDRLAMVYKLCQSGGPGFDGKHGARNVKKYSGSPGKESIAGRPIVIIAHDGTRYIAQQGEGLRPEGGYCRNETKLPKPTEPSIMSPETEAISEACRVRDLGWDTDPF